jgi:hypothetical protein
VFARNSGNQTNKQPQQFYFKKEINRRHKTIVILELGKINSDIYIQWHTGSNITGSFPLHKSSQSRHASITTPSKNEREITT